MVYTPPTYNAPLASKLIFRMGPLVPDEREDHIVPSHRAILFALTPPITVKSPATYSEPSGAITVE